MFDPAVLASSYDYFPLFAALLVRCSRRSPSVNVRDQRAVVDVESRSVSKFSYKLETNENIRDYAS